MKVREEYKGLTMLLSIRLGIDRGGRLEGECLQVASGAPGRCQRLRKVNGVSIP
jgi:hypothetical protein